MLLRIAVADDHAIVSGGVRAVLSADAGNEVVTEVHSPDELLIALAEREHDLLVTDFNMPTGQSVDGLGLMGLISRRWPALPVIVLTQLGSPDVFRNLLQNPSIKAVVHKSDAIRELRQAVAAVTRNERYQSSFVRKLLGPAGGRGVTERAPLSKRETEVLRLFATGKTVSEIAALSHRSIKTISRQKVEAMRKLGLTSDLEFYAYARENGWG